MFRLLPKLPLIIFSLFIFSCDELALDPKEEQPAPAEQTIMYTIPSGGHDSKQASISKLETQHLKFNVKFDSSAVYKTKDPGNQADINKLYGVSDCGTHHHSNSARFGWRWYKEKLEIWAYTYNNNARKFTFIDSVPLHSFQHCEIEFTATQYIFRLNAKTVELPRSCGGLTNGYKLFPYFGGDETAPHDVVIWIEDLK